MSDQDRRQELILDARTLRFKIVRTAITLGLMFANLSRTENSMGNLAQGSWAGENAKRVYKEVQECLPDAHLSQKDMEWIQDRLHELERAIDLKQT